MKEDNEKKPNILFILSDDHAFHAISCYTKGSSERNQINSTPNIDRIANEGVRFDNCFCTNSLCTPSRASILTGKYSHKINVTTLSTKMSNNLETFPKYLQKAGYQTAMIGKWHLGERKKYEPKGFNYWCVLPGQGKYYNPDFIERGKKIEIKGYVTDIITNKCLDWLRNRDKTKPFLLLCHHKAPHRPWEPHEKYSDLYENTEIKYPFTFYDNYANRSCAAKHANMRIENALDPIDLKIKPPLGHIKYLPLPIPQNIDGYNLETLKGEKLAFKSHQELKNWKYQTYIKDYLRCIASIDESVGNLLQYLEQEHLINDTIIVYSSDQGFFLGDYGWYDKRFMYEESLKMPLLIRYSPEIKAGTINKDIITNIDFAETFLDYAGLPIPKDMQGYSFRNRINGKNAGKWQEAVYYRYWTNGTFHKVYAHYGIRTLKYKLIYYYADPMHQKGSRKDPHEPEWEFFDLENDPYELKNEYNNQEYQEIINKMKETLHKMQEEVGDKRYKKDK